MKLRLATLALIGAVALALPAIAAEPLNDLQIAHAAYTADNVDIAYAKLALTKTTNPKVKEFAELMIRDHTAANEAALALLKKLNVQPQDNAFSQALIKSSEAKLAELSKLDGKAFDTAYAANELGYHQVVVKTVANDWIPAIKNEEVKKFFVGANEIFKHHEQHAAAMVAALK